MSALSRDHTKCFGDTKTRDWPITDPGCEAEVPGPSYPSRRLSEQFLGSASPRAQHKCLGVDDKEKA
eukprot:scaffold225335_cov33-Tisochrysis_lutea.AAC.3